ncbi:thermonuclease family protein [Microbaculum marinum]|uniref:Thermonuclease family protein n=1 Tax=Microbaculum marinum TaxID=1764581 RepID=A0AAW9RV90_9HYPH
MAAPLAEILLLGACITAHAPALAGDTMAAGRASVVNGDTIEIDGIIVRLHGIDAPEAGQKCGKAGGGSWPCGNRATEVLEAMAEDRDVECTIIRNDENEQKYGICSAGDLVLNKSMVSEGYAWAIAEGADDYSPAEAEARAAGLGIWQGAAIAPWDYRSERWAAAAQGAPGGCPIKGVVARGEQIYHPPWSPWYDRVKVNESKGGKWFCTEREALEAGWRAASSR